MRTAVTIFLLVLMASIQTPAGQLLKLPLLIEHFIKHQKQNGVSIVVFLDEHYSTNHNDDDKPEDEQLPFKNITFYAIGYAIMPDVIKANAMAALPGDKKVIFGEIYAPQQHLARIFHPPRM